MSNVGNVGSGGGGGGGAVNSASSSNKRFFNGNSTGSPGYITTDSNGFLSSPLTTTTSTLTTNDRHLGTSFTSPSIKRVAVDGEYMYPFELSTAGSGGGGGSTTNGVSGGTDRWFSNGGLRNGVGKLSVREGKKKEMDDGQEDEEMDVDEDADEDEEAVGEGNKMIPVRREEFVRVVLQALRDVGYGQSAQVLEAESGYVQEPPVIQSFSQSILGGRWSEAIALLRELEVITDFDRYKPNGELRTGRRSLPDIAEVSTNGGTITPDVITFSQSVPVPEFHVGSALSISPADELTTTNGTRSLIKVEEDETRAQDDNDDESTSHGLQAIFMILQQKYLELLELGQTKRALTVLRGELAPLVRESTRKARGVGVSVDSDRLHALSGFMMCLDRNDLYRRAKWDGAAGDSRHTLLNSLQRFIAPGVMIPPRRLQTLFDQASRHQRTKCMYHTDTASTSLLWDHNCARRQFPTVTTHILAEHTNEVWVLEWSNSGKYLASGSADHTVIVWKVGSLPERRTERQCVLHGHQQPVMAMAWSKDDKRLLTAADNTLFIWDPEHGALIHTVSSVHTDQISSIRWLPDGSGFVTSAMDMRLIFWTRAGTLKTSWNTYPLRITDFVITPDGKRLIAIAMMTDSQKDAQGAVKPAASRATDGATAGGTAAGSDAATNYPMAKMDRHIVIYNVETGKIQCRRPLPQELTSITLTDDNDHVLINTVPDELQLWSIHRDTLHLVRRFSGHVQREYQIKSCLGGIDKNFVLSGSEDSHVYVWHKDTGALLEVLEGHDQSVNSVAWNPVETGLFASSSDDCTIRLWQSPSVAEAMRNHVEPSASSGGIDWATVGDTVEREAATTLEDGHMDMLF